MQGPPGVAASTFRLDIKAAEIHGAFRAAQVETVLLKGRAFADLLYPDPGTRPYEDVDFLVAPAALGKAEELLRRWGFSAADPESPARQSDRHLGPTVGAQGRHSRAWLRTRDNLVVDLHDSLPQVGAEPELVWSRLTLHITTISVAGSPVAALDHPASALLIALHAAHHGPNWRTTAREDLERATEKLEIRCWAEAHQLAVELLAESGMATGLGLTTGGIRVAQALGLDTTPTPALQVLWSGAPWSETFVDALLTQPSFGARAQLVARVLWPSRAAMRRGSSLARRSRRGLVAAYGLRLCQLMVRLPAAIRRVRRS